MERESGDGDDNRRRRRRGAFGYRFRLLNFLLLGHWAYLIFVRMRNILRLHRMRLARRRGGIRRLPGKLNRKTCNPHQQGDSSSSSHDEFEESSGTIALQKSVVTVHQESVPTKDKPNVINPPEAIAGPSGIQKISSKEYTSTDVTEAESRETTNIEERPTKLLYINPLAVSMEDTSDDSDTTIVNTHDEFSYIDEIPTSPRSHSPLDSEESSNDEEQGATTKSTDKKDTTE